MERPGSLSTPEDTDALGRLRYEQEQADRAYNAALTRLDRALHGVGVGPAPPPWPDEHQVPSLNAAWDLLGHKPSFRSGWRGRLQRFVWALVAPLFEHQQTFNSMLVDHNNRDLEVSKRLAQTVAATQAWIGDELGRLEDFQSKLVQYAQQITPYVDTKDRYVAGLPSALGNEISILHDEIQKRAESMLARERRYQAEIDEIRTTLAATHRAILAIGRQLDERPQTEPAASRAVEQEQPRSPVRSLDSSRYVTFEDQFRGSRQLIRDRMTMYLPLFAGASDVLDVGCGRGEFLELLAEQGISARGIDLNAEMVAVARDHGVSVTSADALSYLTGLSDGALGGLFSAQVVEHFESGYLLELLDTAFLKLRPGSKIVLETINPSCWYAFFSSYIRDITHVRPLHPDTLRYLLLASGFQKVEIRYSAPFPEDSKLQPLPAGELSRSTSTADHASGVLVTTFNQNVEKLNSLLFTYQDYAVIGERP